MASKKRIALLIGLLISLMVTEPIKGISPKKLLSIYEIISVDIHRLLGRNKITDPKQKKRVMIEIAAGLTLILLTGTFMWIWWIRPLQKRLQQIKTDEEYHSATNNTASENQEFQNLKEGEVKPGAISLQHIFLNGQEKWLHEQIIAIASDQALSKPDEYGNTVLHYAASRPLPTVVKKLIERNVPIDARNTIGETPLHFAAFSNQLEMVKLLITSHANPTIVNNEGKTPAQVTTDPAIQSFLQEAAHAWRAKSP